MNKKVLISILFCSCIIVDTTAQVKVANTGKVGVCIADTIEPLSSLSVGGKGVNYAGISVDMKSQSISSNNNWCNIYSSLNAQSSPQWNNAVIGTTNGVSSTDRLIGVNGSALKASISSSGRSYGVLGVAGRCSSGYNYGVCGFLQTSTEYGAAIYGGINSYSEVYVPGRCAGYFKGQTRVNGDFYATTVNTTSDARLKTNIKDVRTETLDKIQALHPIQFTWQQVEDKHTADTATVKSMYFSDDIDLTRSHYGFLAQEVQKIFPELVQQDGDGYLSINYVELIPLLVQAVQDLSNEVAELKKEKKEY